MNLQAHLRVGVRVGVRVRVRIRVRVRVRVREKVGVRPCDVLTSICVLPAGVVANFGDMEGRRERRGGGVSWKWCVQKGQK